MFENICIFFSDTGGGHRSAVDALEAAIKEVAAADPNHRVVQVTRETIVENSHPLNRKFVELYNYLLRHHQPLMKYYYRFLHFARPNESWLGYQLVKAHLRRWLKEHAPSVVVSAHPMTNHYIGRAMVEVGMKEHIKLITVITDPNADLWRGWACEQTDLFIAPNDIVRDKLLQWGIALSRIAVLGMPVHPDFTRDIRVDRSAFLSRLGLAPGVLTVCINAGWAGGGNSLSVYRALSRTDVPLQVIFLCGHNSRLYDRAIEEAGKSPVATAVLPFHDRMSELMRSCDLMVTKAGGLTTFQCIASRLPMALDVITEPMPQERGTVDLLVNSRLARPIRRPDDILDIVARARVVEDRAAQLPAVHSLDRTGAVFDMARIILQNSQIAIEAFEPAQTRQLDVSAIKPSRREATA